MKDVYDVCMFFNENDLLEIRINEHWDFVKKFIIIESLQTHAGHEKPQNFDSKRFEKYSDKIEYVLIDSLDELYDNKHLLAPSFFVKWAGHKKEQIECWKRENLQTNYCIEVLKKLNAKDEDWVLWGGLDEIVKSESMLSLPPAPIYSFELKTYVYKLNIYFKDMAGPLVSSYENYKKYLPSELRSSCVGFSNMVKDAGWHFTGLSKTKENLRDKYTSFSHSKDAFWQGIENLSDDDLESKVITSYIENFFDDPSNRVVKIDKTFPKFIRDNIELLNDYIYKEKE